MTPNDSKRRLLVAGALEEESLEEAPTLESLSPEREIDYLRAILLFLIPALGGLLFGYDIGATSGAIDSIKSATKSGTDWYALTSFQEGLAVSCALLGAMAGSLFIAFYGSKIGRKTELLLAPLAYGSFVFKTEWMIKRLWALGVGILLTVTAHDYGLLCCGRSIYGLGIAFAMHGGPSFIAETAPASLRGLFISAKEALIVFGILLGYLFSFLFVDRVGGWRWDYGVSIPIIFIFGTGMIFLPESPRYLILNGRIDAARKALLSVIGTIRNKESVAEQEMAMMQSVMEEQSGESEGLFQRRNWKALYITVSLVLFQQATGQPSVLYYAQEIFQKAEIFSESSDASAAAVVIGVWKLLTTMIAASRVESLGRRPLLLAGASGLTAAVALLSLCTWLEDAVPSLSTPMAWGGVVALLLYVGCYQFSFGPIVWLLVGELYPLEVRTEGIALCTFTNFSSNFVVSLLFPVLSDTVGLSAEYLIFALIGVASIVSIYQTVPETKGRSLEEIEALMQT